MSISTASQAGQDASAPSRASLSRWLELGFLLLLPQLVYWLFHLRPFHQAGTLDPYFYTGYIQNPEDLLRRFGLPYYAVRFGLILPGHYFSRLFGPEPGYLAFRYVLALLAGIPLYCFARRTFHISVAVLSYFALITSPWFERNLLWDHPDATGVPYLLAAMCLPLMSRAPGWKRDGLAGCLASLAVNSNVFTAAILGIFGVVYCVVAVWCGDAWRVLARRAAYFAAGFVLVLLCGYVWYWQVFGEPRNIFAPTVKMIAELSGGGMKQYRGDPFEWLPRLFHVFVPVLVALACLAAGLVRRTHFEMAVCSLSGAAVVAFFYVHQFLMNGDTLEYTYYFSYALPSTFLMLACLWQWLRERNGGNAGLLLAASIASLLLPPAMASAGRTAFAVLSLRVWAGLALAALLLVALSRISWRRREIRGGVAIVATVTLLLAFGAGFGRTYQVVRPLHVHDDVELDMYRVSLQFIDAVPKLKDTDGKLVFWYDASRQGVINSVQSTYLFTWTTLNQLSPDVNMPRLAEYQLQILRDPNARYVVLLGESPDEIQQGLRSLTESHTGYRLVSTREFISGKFHVNYQLIELITHPPGA